MNSMISQNHAWDGLRFFICFGKNRFLKTFRENKDLIFGVGFRTRFGMPLGMRFDRFLESFWILLGALGAPLGDFW